MYHNLLLGIPLTQDLGNTLDPLKTILGPWETLGFKSVSSVDFKSLFWKMAVEHVTPVIDVKTLCAECCGLCGLGGW
jgi:hypothetical protein